jgi:ATP synthase protein I
MHKFSSGAAVAKAVCLTQGGIAAVAAIIFGALAGRDEATAAVYGGAVAVVPTAYFAVRALAGPAGRHPQEVAGAFYRGEVGKMVLTALLFALGAAVFAQQFLALIVTYAVCLLAYWLVMARVVFETGGSD